MFLWGNNGIRHVFFTSAFLLMQKWEWRQRLKGIRNNGGVYPLGSPRTFISGNWEEGSGPGTNNKEIQIPRQCNEGPRPLPTNLRPKAECHLAPFLLRTSSPWGYFTVGTLTRASTIREWASSVLWAALLPGLSVKHRIRPVVFGRFHLYLLSLLSPVKELSKWFSDIDFLLFLNRNWRDFRWVYITTSLPVKWGHLCDLIHRVVWIHLYEMPRAKQGSQSLLNKNKTSTIITAMTIRLLFHNQLSIAMKWRTHEETRSH